MWLLSEELVVLVEVQMVLDHQLAGRDCGNMGYWIAVPLKQSGFLMEKSQRIQILAQPLTPVPWVRKW